MARSTRGRTFTELDYLVCDINVALMGSYTLGGRRDWWLRRRTELDGLTPSEMLRHDPERVLRLAQSLK